jgi:hypothetical protein
MQPELEEEFRKTYTHRDVIENGERIQWILMIKKELMKT